MRYRNPELQEQLASEYVLQNPEGTRPEAL